MKKHFFLEGPIQEGKSTLLRSLIQDHLQEIGGFSSQRLLNGYGETVGFRIAPAEEAMELTKEYSADLSDVFLYFDSKVKQSKPEIFSGAALRYLKERYGKKLILLDEIGGIELLDTEFLKELYATLRGDIPCLGVLKLEASNRNMCRGSNIDSDCTDRLLRLRKDLIDSLNADILQFIRSSTKETEEAAKAFVDAAFAERRV